VWRTDRVPPAPGQAPEVAIRADIEIPEQHISMRWLLRPNRDKSLPASHTVEIVFTLPADFPHGSIANIPGVLMKQGESTRGIPLAGLAVKVTTNFFLIGLSSIDADMQRNIQLLKERPWFDIPIVYGDGQRALIAVEKGTPGERVFAEAFAAWGRPGELQHTMAPSPLVPVTPTPDPCSGPATVSSPSRCARAVLYEEDASDPSGRQFVGTAVWRTDRVPPAPGQAPEVKISADVEFPDRHISLRWSLQRNQVTALPASHTIEVAFKLPPDDPHGGISGIPGVLMKTTESTPGDQLAGIGVKAAPDLFLISLSTAEADMQRNVQLLKERPWFDIPVAFDDGRRAIIAVEKGAAGEKAFAEAFSSEAFSSWEPAVQHPFTIAEGSTSEQAVQHQITIAEGLTSEQIVQRLLETDILSGNIKEIPREGTMLPETYRFTHGTPRDQVILRIQQAQRRVVQEIWDRRMPNLPLRSPEQLVTHASIVEKETSRSNERTRVAAVFIKRLRLHMKLQSDPTVIYGLVGGKGTLGRPIQRSEIEQPTPYNTYVIDGLPPGPIANPGRAAIEAVANPAPTKELYFAADGTGGHAFSETLDQHQKNVTRLRAASPQVVAALAPWPRDPPPASAPLEPAEDGWPRRCEEVWPVDNHNIAIEYSQPKMICSPPSAVPQSPAIHSGWIIQVGAFETEGEARQKLSAVQAKVGSMLDRADPFTEPVVTGDKTVYRARFAGLQRSKAEAICRQLKRNDIDCMTIKN
jgi:cell division protein YceG involved in septum cleavage